MIKNCPRCTSENFSVVVPGMNGRRDLVHCHNCGRRWQGGKHRMIMETIFLVLGITLAAVGFVALGFAVYVRYC